MDSSRRLAGLEKTLELWYEQLNDAEKALPMTIDPNAKTAIKQRIREEILPAIRKYEVDYLLLLAKNVPSCEEIEVNASVAIVEIVPEIKQIVNRSSTKYHDELMEKLQEIIDKLNEPETPAAAKLKAALPLIPGIMYYELELDTEISLIRVFERMRQHFQKAIKKKT